MNRILIGVAGDSPSILLIAFAAVDRPARRSGLRVVGAAFVLQAGIAVLVLKVPAGVSGRSTLSCRAASPTLLGYANAGTSVPVRRASRPIRSARTSRFRRCRSSSSSRALVSILYYVGIMQLIVRWIGGGIEFVIGVSKVESLCAAANIFVGQSESPLVIRPYLASAYAGAAVHRDDQRHGRASRAPSSPPMHRWASASNTCWRQASWRRRAAS